MFYFDIDYVNLFDFKFFVYWCVCEVCFFCNSVVRFIFKGYLLN